MFRLVGMRPLRKDDTHQIWCITATMAQEKLHSCSLGFAETKKGKLKKKKRKNWDMKNGKSLVQKLAQKLVRKLAQKLTVQKKWRKSWHKTRKVKYKTYAQIEEKHRVKKKSGAQWYNCFLALRLLLQLCRGVQILQHLGGTKPL